LNLKLIFKVPADDCSIGDMAFFVISLFLIIEVASIYIAPDIDFNSRKRGLYVGWPQINDKIPNYDRNPKLQISLNKAL